MYTCDAANRKCEKSSTGTMAGDACQAACEPKELYSCDATTKKCEKDTAGKQSKDDCEAACV
jgi:hypothetical protein